MFQTCEKWLRAALWDSLYSPLLHVWIPDLALNLKYKIENFTGLVLENVHDIFMLTKLFDMIKTYNSDNLP